MEKTLKQRYEEVAQAYRLGLIKKFCPNEEVPYDDSYWVNDEIGGELALRQNFYDYGTIRSIVDNNVQYETWEDWHQYCQAVGGFGVKTPTLEEWRREGCPRLSREIIGRLAKTKQDLQEQTEEKKKDC